MWLCAVAKNGAVGDSEEWEEVRDEREGLRDRRGNVGGVSLLFGVSVGSAML